MSGVIHVLSASITSALAVKPSTVYVLRVENTQNRDVWHIRRCFSEFCDLREKMIVLIEGQSGSGSSATNSGNGSTSAQNSPTPVALTAMRLLSLNPSLKSSTPCSSNTNSPRSTSAAGTGPVQERYPFLYNKFPRRQFFGSRTKKVIEQRTLALNQFLQEALWFIREVKTQHNIAMYFSLMTQLEAFFDCGRHQPSTAAGSGPTTSSMTVSSISNQATTSSDSKSRPGLYPPFYTAPVSVAAAPVMPFAMPVSSYDSRTSPEVDYNAKEAADRARAVAARGFWHAPTGVNYDDDESDEEADDYEERKVLKKSISCFLGRDVRERPMLYHHNSAKQFAAALQTRASERDQVVSAADAWAARIEIAGIPPVEALRRRASQNQAMLVQQYASPAATVARKASRSDAETGAVLYAMKDRGDHVRRECLT